MTRYVAFLRGMNVGGHRITNAELCAAFEEIGLPDAATFRASGNVVFDAPGGDPRVEIAARIEQGLEQTLGYAVPTFLRDAAEMRAIAAQEPFTASRITWSLPLDALTCFAVNGSWAAMARISAASRRKVGTA